MAIQIIGLSYLGMWTLIGCLLYYMRGSREFILSVLSSFFWGVGVVVTTASIGIVSCGVLGWLEFWF